MGLLKAISKEILFYAPTYAGLTVFGGFLNEVLNTKDLIERKFFQKKLEGKDPIPVFLIPGTLGGRGTMLLLKRRLKRYFKDVFIFKPARFELVSLEKNIKKLNDFIEVKLKLVGQQRLIIIGHSQGGIIARRWFNLYDPKGEITRAIVTLGTPHAGSWAAVAVLPFMWWSRAVWQLTPFFAQKLDETPSAEKTISIEGRDDPAFISWPYQAKRIKRVEVEGMHISPIFEKKIFKKIKEELP